MMEARSKGHYRTSILIRRNCRLHQGVLTVFYSHGEVSTRRQSDILKTLGLANASTQDEIVDLLTEFKKKLDSFS